MALKKGTQIVNRGPKDAGNGAEVFRFVREGNKKNYDLAIGQVVTVGEEISAEEGNQLLKSTTWEFEEVKNGGND
jgi:hypothetical protein